ncbi:hypothetical protein B0H11DRAFT_1974927 [Mycena galericulata]|nr:hypothetical protein B0H11DRAFT_1984348 [Mycena galericulata]KAJ7506159.1 hypothetical protein B0H11DRAFT_1974927 [Mycena galericulata]
MLPGVRAAHKEGKRAQGYWDDYCFARRRSKRLESGLKIELDNHHLVPHSHYELGRLLTCLGDVKEARRHCELYLEVGPSESGKKNALHMRTNADVET